MKKDGILHKELLNLLCTVGHGDYIMITDRGFPIPDSEYTHVIDLGLAPGIPDFKTIADLVIPQLEIDCLYFTNEMNGSNKPMVSHVTSLLPHNTPSCFMNHVDMKQALLNPNAYHERTAGFSVDDSREQKQLLENSRIIGFIRTGEFTKYTNILIECGVAF